MDVASHFNVVPVLREGDVLFLAVLDLEVGEEVGKTLPMLTGLTVKPVTLDQTAMERLLEKY